MFDSGRGLYPIFGLLSMEVEGLDALVELALDMRWSWNHSADEIWMELDPTLWDLTHNPWLVLQTVSRVRLQQALSDTGFRGKVDTLVNAKRTATETPAWFQQAHAGSPLTCAAYFSMEFMVSEALPIYSGGLGNVAGDQLKAASDLGVPVVGIGLLYQQGYFRQVVDREGRQHALFPYNDPGQLPVMPVREANGEWLRLQVELPGYSVWLRAWQVRVGRVTLYLLDSNDPANFPAHRGITGELYGGGPQVRLIQEMVLGIGGWRLLCTLGIRPEVCHLNEGHAAFAVLERARCYMAESGHPFAAALAVTRAGNLFTTHTPVSAGFDRFTPEMMEHCLGSYVRAKLDLPFKDFLALGRLDPADDTEPFNMAYLALRGSCAVNGVSRLHGQVSRRIFQQLFPRWPEQEVPVGHVTNGVHVPSWESTEAEHLWSSSCSSERWLGAGDKLEDKMICVQDRGFWKLRASARRSLIAHVRERLSRQLAVTGATPAEAEEARHRFDDDALTLVFARRFATYKRPDLLLHDPVRLLRILTDPCRPVQLIVAGKAHPDDMPGQDMIRRWIQFINGTRARQHATFLSDYDMQLTTRLVQGADVWINTPRRPWEACGTSGMKVLVNGGVNLSELDGWWAEAYTPEVGWALGDGREHGDDPAWDAVEAEELYRLLEEEVIPEFYNRDRDGIPRKWVARMRESMARLTPRFSASRMVRDYTEDHYLPAAAAYRSRAAGNGAAAAGILDWQRRLEVNWKNLRFGEIRVETTDGVHRFEAQVYLNGIEPDAVRVELFAEDIAEGTAAALEMERCRQLVGANAWIYHADVPASRPAGDFTARIVPCHPGAAVPLEAPWILWQR